MRIPVTAMHNFPSHSLELSNWRQAAQRRLRVSLLVATVFVAGLLSMMRLPEFRILNPLVELIVDITRYEDPSVQVELAPEEMPVRREASEVAVDQTSLPVESAPDVGEIVEEQVAESAAQAIIAERSFDWEAAKTDAVQSAVDDLGESLRANPSFDEQRAVAAVKFRASEAPVKKEIWENVEKDELGRTLLRKGDCYRVLDDPSAVNRWAFENFGQYITYCTNRKYVGKDLAWVKDIHQRFAYLRNRMDRRDGIFIDN
ncbi:MAG: hypothetical protein ACR2Q3_05700 [Woeseiaceae bacterium]